MIEKIDYRFCTDMETIQVPDGYDMKNVPDLTRNNIQVLADKINELIETVNNIEAKLKE